VGEGEVVEEKMGEATGKAAVGRGREEKREGCRHSWPRGITTDKRIGKG
jgi:hypothetical protein